MTPILAVRHYAYGEVVGMTFFVVGMKSPRVLRACS